MKTARVLSLLTIGLVTLGCQPVDLSQHGEQLTVAKVQREIKLGMSSSQVVEVLGSPNMVTTDDERRETWVYDKVSTEISTSQAQSGVWLLIAGTGQSGSRHSQNQRTLTIIIKFDSNSKVRDFAYRTSTF
jgi:outer membrane protein assembly factor BamE (lipoprotein component of BamABCDE complex)